MLLLTRLIELITTLAGSGVHELKDGEGLSASFGNPWGICFNPHDHCFYIGDSGNNAIRKLTIEGMSCFIITSSILLEIN